MQKQSIRISLSALMGTFVLSSAALYAAIGYEEVPPPRDATYPVTIYRVGWPLKFYAWFRDGGSGNLVREFIFINFCVDIAIFVTWTLLSAVLMRFLFPVAIRPEEKDTQDRSGSSGL